MSRTILIFEDDHFVDFFPLSLAQPVFDLRIGAGTLRTRWVDADPSARVALICRDYLADVVRSTAANVSVNAAPAGETLFVNARLVCFADERDALLSRLGENAIALDGANVLAARLGGSAAAEFAAYLRSRVSDAVVDAACALLKARASAPAADAPASTPTAELAKLIDTHKLKRVELAGARVLAYPWHLIEHNAACIRDDFARGARGVAGDASVHASVRIVEPERVAVGAKASIRAGVVIDATDGPVVIGEGVVVMPNAVVVGPAAIGAGSTVKAGARILAGTSIGRVCKVGGEVDEAIFADYSNKQHDGFLGHSYLGSWVNIGAAGNNSDLKNNYGLVRMWNAGRARDTGRQFLGLVMGDHTKTGINAVFNTGTVVGFNCNLYSSEMPDAFVPSFSWGHGSELQRYELAKAMQTASAVMQRRGVGFGDAHRRVFERVHDIVEKSGRNA